MSRLVVHPKTQEQLDRLVEAPTQVIILAGPAGSGKFTLAGQLAEQLLGLGAGDLATHAYGRIISPEDGKAVGIEAIRDLERFLSLKVPSNTAYNRAVIIEDSHLLTTEAQNALLKTLEEPPAGAVLILTASHDKALLPTIRSRSQVFTARKPTEEAFKKFFGDQGHDAGAVQQAYAISGGLPGLASALLSDEEHPLLVATQQARQLLSQPQYERLLTVDALAKQRELAIDTVGIMQQMAHVSLHTAQGKAARRWQAIQQASYEAAEALRANGQPKLVLTNLVLQF